MCGWPDHCFPWWSEDYPNLQAMASLTFKAYRSLFRHPEDSRPECEFHTFT